MWVLKTEGESLLSSCDELLNAPCEHTIAYGVMEEWGGEGTGGYIVQIWETSLLPST